MRYKFVIFLFLLSTQFSFAQDSTDAIRLRSLRYMQSANPAHCLDEETTGIPIFIRTCLNFEFQRVDSILNKRVLSYLATIEADSSKQQFQKHHQNWINYRRFQSSIVVRGLQGNALGIRYLDCMVQMTKKRIEEIAYFIWREQN